MTYKPKVQKFVKSYSPTNKQFKKTFNLNELNVLICKKVLEKNNNSPFVINQMKVYLFSQRSVIPPT